MLDAVYILSDDFEGIEILFGQRKFKEFARIGDALRKTVEAADDIVEHLLFFAYFLGVFGIIPEVRVLNFPIYFFEAELCGRRQRYPRSSLSRRVRSSIEASIWLMRSASISDLCG